jgi:hypothetical protein
MLPITHSGTQETEIGERKRFYSRPTLKTKETLHLQSVSRGFREQKAFIVEGVQQHQAVFLIRGGLSFLSCEGNVAMNSTSWS